MSPAPARACDLLASAAANASVMGQSDAWQPSNSLLASLAEACSSCTMRMSMSARRRERQTTRERSSLCGGRRTTVRAEMSLDRCGPHEIDVKPPLLWGLLACKSALSA